MNITRSMVPAATAVALLALAPATRAGDEEHATVRHRVVINTSDGEAHDQDVFFVNSDGADKDGNIVVQGHSVEVVVDNGEVTVRLDGKEIPADRIVHKDGQVKILGEDGTELDSVFVGRGEGGVWMRKDGKNLGFAPGIQYGFTTAAPKDPPKVMLGVTLDAPSAALASHLGLDAGVGTIISNVMEKLAADRAGLEQWDVIVSVNGKKGASPDAIREILAKSDPGDALELMVIRGGQKRGMTVKLDAFDAKALGWLQPTEMDFTIADGELPFGPHVIGGNALRGVVIDGENGVYVPKLNIEHWFDSKTGSFHVDPNIETELQFGVPHADEDDDDQPVDARIERLRKRIAELERLLTEIAKDAGG